MMNQHKEIELKFIFPGSFNPGQIWLTPLVVAGLAQCPSFRTLNSRYYDATDHRLLRHGVVCRLRSDGGHRELTIKKEGQVEAGLHQRLEWNAVVTDEFPRLDAVQDPDLRREMETLMGETPFQVLFSTFFVRVCGTWTSLNGDRIEIAVDQGKILAGDCQQSIAELELELVEGDCEALNELGRQLSVLFPLTPCGISKFHRGLQMLESGR